ncbi:uncharacterized protein BXZ73DRAFT_76891 [Epithele typhae]|uniref:uncharacterized protein n=1 Tax=Epithele typhae TaxID=378194 RepID=UPI002008482C|nr:uncharacterized protein BXZ73DRAFT_76891 [Epithele typhae]KAH9935194.1 hypothetical protein BXZ73DRAFT_76891 [Epithele typhae]
MTPVPPQPDLGSSFYDLLLRSLYPTGQDFRPRFELFADFLRFRYGLIASPQKDAHLAYDTYGPEALRKFFGLLEEDMPMIATETFQYASVLVTALIKDKERPSAPGFIWDLNPSSSGHLGRALGSGSIHLRPQILNDGKLVRIRYGNPDPSSHWDLFVDSVTSLELYRRRSHISSAFDAIGLLSSRGTQFLIASKLPQGQQHQSQVVDFDPDFLGRSDPKVRKNKFDYEAYEIRASELLALPRGRAAIQRGGIVWRIAKELLGEERTADFHPSDDLWSYGAEHHRPGRTAVYSDNLSPYELKIVCGVYKAEAGEVSWWPTPDQWDKGGYNVGRWTPFAEEWFQIRLDRIRCNEETVRSRAEWKRGIKVSSGAIKLRDAVHVASTMFVTNALAG